MRQRMAPKSLKGKAMFAKPGETNYEIESASAIAELGC